MHYTGTIWRPPYEAYSLLVQVTAGCTHHSCKFCTLYEDLPFKFKLSPFSEVKADLAEASKYYRKIPRIFFTGANPFVLSTEKLKTLAKMVKEYYPFYKTIGCFARITDIMPKSLEELKELRALTPEESERLEAHKSRKKIAREKLVQQAATDPAAAAELAKKRAHQSQATKKSRQKMYEEAATGNPEAVERYENYLVTRRESYHRKKQEAERTA